MYSAEELETIHDKIKKRLSRYIELGLDERFEEMANMFTEDGCFANGTDIARGREQVLEALKAFPPVEKAEIHSHIIYEGDGKIYEMGTNLLGFGEGEDYQEVKGNYVTIWVEQDGEWYIKHDLIPPTPE